jgi:alpha-beta hydrolase superfamily lysophospholipase
LQQLLFTLEGAATPTGRGDSDAYDVVLGDSERFLVELSQLAPGPYFLFGHSAGAAFALHVASRSTHPIAGMVLVNPAYRLKASAGMTPSFGQMLQFAVNLVFRPAALTVDMNSNPDAILFPPDREEGLALQRDPLSVRFFSMRYLLAEQQVLKNSEVAIARIDAPVLFVEGVHDGLVDPTGTDALFRSAKSTDKARLTAPDGGHGSSAVETMVAPILEWLIQRRDKASRRSGAKDAG